MSKLEDSIQNLYAAFSKIRKPLKIEGCECCMDEQELRRLLSYDVRSVPMDVLAPYASSAILTVGTVDDYLYFLPRILHTYVLDESFWPDVEITARAINSTDLSEWPNERLDALKSFLSNLIRSFLAPQQQHRIDDWMCAIGRMGLPVRSYLSDIQSSKDAVLAYFESNSKVLPAGKLDNAFWELPNTAHEQIVDWFYSPAIRQVLRKEYGYILPARPHSG